jgi:hypothetical protein
VLAGLDASTGRVAVSNRLENRNVELGQVGLVPVRPVRRERRRHLDAEHEPGLQERLVVGHLDDRAVEREVVRDLSAPVARRRGRPHRLHLSLEKIDVAVRVPSRFPRGELLERHPHREDR